MWHPEVHCWNAVANRLYGLRGAHDARKHLMLAVLAAPVGRDGFGRIPVSEPGLVRRQRLEAGRQRSDGMQAIPRAVAERHPELPPVERTV